MEKNNKNSKKQTDQSAEFDSFGEALGRLVKERRGDMEWSQEVLADHAGINNIKTISRLEAGHIKKPQTRTVQGLCAALNISPAEIQTLKLRTKKVKKTVSKERKEADKKENNETNTIPNRIVILSTALVGIVVAIGITVFFWFGANDQAEPDKNTNVTAKSPIPDTSQITPSNTRPKPDTDEIDILRITKSGERRRSKHHPPKALFTVWNGKLFLKDLILPKDRPILKVEYSRFGNTFTPFDPSDDQLDRSLAPDGSFLVKATFQINNSPSLKEYDLTTQRYYHLRTVASGFNHTVTKDNINRHVSCVDNICAIQRSFSNNALCFGPVLRGRLISGFEKFEVSRNICKDDAPLPLCLNEDSLGFKLGRNARVVFEVDLIDGTSRRYDVSARTEGVLLPSGDFVSLDALGGTLIHKCN